MNRKARKMNKQHQAGKPTTGRAWPCGIVIGLATAVVALTSWWAW